MQIEQNGANELIITGNIKSIEDGMVIKEAINVLQNNSNNSIVLKIIDSFSMTSTVIGHLMKLVKIDKIRVSVVVGDSRLFELLDELNLVQTFNVRLTGE